LIPKKCALVVSRTTGWEGDLAGMIFKVQARMTHGRVGLLWISLLVVLGPSPARLCAQENGPQTSVAFSAGMGVSYINAPSIVDYLNKYTSQADRVADFTPAVEFFAAPEVPLSPTLILKLEYAYLLKSYSLVESQGTYSFDYSVHMPTVVLNYLLEGDKFYVKVGGGIGYHFGKFSYLFPNASSEARFTGGGLGLKLELMGNTAFGESLYGLIGGDIRLDFIGALKDADGKGPAGAIDPVKLRFASAGIKFGLIYYF
jgi:hypothetical protein